MDSEVCAILRTKDRTFDVQKQLEILEMKDEIGEWRLEHARREADQAIRTHPTAEVGFGGQEEVPGNPASYDVPAPVDVSGLLPPPRLRAKNSTMEQLRPIRLESTNEEAEGVEETAEAIALRIDSMDSTERQAKPEKKSKTRLRNT